MYAREKKHTLGKVFFSPLKNNHFICRAINMKRNRVLDKTTKLFEK
jgi:hypothetical protein